MLTNKEAEKALKPLLTKEFLQVLVFALETEGHSTDFCETTSFVDNCFHIAGIEAPSEYVANDDYSDELIK